jgi:hypothetical protein
MSVGQLGECNMTNSCNPSYLSEQQRREACAILTVGCDRETAARFVNCSPADLRRAMATNATFAADVRRAEASSEVTHMRNVQSAGREEKNWRASVWWLERHAPHRYGRRDGETVTPGQLKTFVAMLVSMAVDEIHDEADVRRLTARFNEAIRSLDELPDDEVTSAEQLRLAVSNRFTEGLAADGERDSDRDSGERV